MSWKDIIKFNPPFARRKTKEELEERKNRKRYTKTTADAEMEEISNMFEQQLKERGGKGDDYRSLTTQQARRLLSLYEKLQGNKLSEYELKDVAFVYILGKEL